MRSTLLAVAMGVAGVILLPEDAQAQAGPVGGSGRYVIVHSPHVQRDTVLLDTQTGKTWQLRTDSAAKEDFWIPMARSDNAEEMRAIEVRIRRQDGGDDSTP